MLFVKEGGIVIVFSLQGDNESKKVVSSDFLDTSNKNTIKKLSRLTSELRFLRQQLSKKSFLKQWQDNFTVCFTGARKCGMAATQR